jgi:hypothetical protein
LYVCPPAQPFVLFLQYNYIATKLSLSWPGWVYSLADVLQAFFGGSQVGAHEIDRWADRQAGRHYFGGSQTGTHEIV